MSWENFEEIDAEIPVDDLKGLPTYSWVVRKCESYKREYKDCKSVKERFHQYFIHGEVADCSHWKQNYDSCILYRKTKNLQALEDVTKEELKRKEERLAGHLANDVWEKRDDGPPPNWNCDLLPVTEENRKKFPSYISAMKELSKDGEIDKKSSCVIS